MVYICLYLTAPLIACFFSIPALTNLLRVLGLCVVFNSFSVVQNALFIANLEIKKLTLINVSVQISVGLFSIYCAYIGCGVWTLVIQQIGTSFCKALLLWIISKWKPLLKFSKQSFKYLFDFGWKLLGANLLGTFFNEIYSFVIGKFLGAADLGYYTKSKTLSTYPNSILTNIINRIMLPIMTEIRGDDDTRVRTFYLQMLELICFFTFPLFGALIVIAKPLILVMWTAKWLNSVFLFQLFCAGAALAPIASLNFSLLQLVNRTDIMLKLELIKKPLCFGLLLISIPFGLKGIVIFAVIYNFIGTIVNMYPTQTILNYSIWNQIWIVFKYLLLVAGPVTIALYAIGFVPGYWTQIGLGLLVIALSYGAITMLFKVKGYKYLINIIKR